MHVMDVLEKGCRISSLNMYVKKLIHIECSVCNVLLDGFFVLSETGIVIREKKRDTHLLQGP
jgi:hypothetical protein